MLAYRIAKKMIKSRGDTSFLAGKDKNLGDGLRTDFIDTPNGIKRADGKTLSAPTRV